MKVLARSIFLYPGFDGTGERFIGEAKRAPAGIPVETIRISKVGRGKNKVYRHLINTAAPAGWGEFSKQTYYGWIDESDLAEKNPRTRRNPSEPLPKNRYHTYKGSRRDLGIQYPHVSASAPGAEYCVQVKRGKKWHPLARFYSKVFAQDYGQALANKYPQQTFRVHWPDALERRIKKNPAPRAESAAAPQHDVEQAARLFQDFTGHRPARARRVRIPQARAGLVVGPLLAVAYETTRDGKREKYLHEFRRGARPTLAASADGRFLYVLGGAFRFTERGIVDKA